MTRKQKVELLKNILAGKTSIQDLQPKNCMMIIQGGQQGNEYFIDSKPVSKGQFDCEIEKIPKPWWPDVYIGDLHIRHD